MSEHRIASARARRSALDMPADEFRSLGHGLVERIADFYDSLDERAVTRVATPHAIRRLLGDEGIPEHGTEAAQLLADAVPLLFENSLHNGHPKFMGYVTSSAAPLGVLADLLAAALNCNLARWDLAPIASEIEARALGWIADFIGYDRHASGVMVSGGSAANFLAFVAARKAMLPWDVRRHGNYADARWPTAYVSEATHSWVQKAADVCGLGAEGIRWIATDSQGRMRLDALRRQIERDRNEDRLPFLVVGTAGTVGLGAIDPLREMAALCREQNLWFHVDGAYGAAAAALPEAPDDLHALSQADSVAVDPHKWLYCPIEVACVLTKHSQALRAAFGFRPEYYRLPGRKASGTDYHELGMQNTRGFRALKVWLMFKAVGRAGYRESIRGDIAVAEKLYGELDRHPDFATAAVNLSVVTFRYVPRDLDGSTSDELGTYLDTLNQALLAELQASGDLFVSNAVIDSRYYLRACIVNFRTLEKDVDAVPGIIAEVGQRIDRTLRPAGLATASCEDRSRSTASQQSQHQQ